MHSREAPRKCFCPAFYVMKHKVRLRYRMGRNKMKQSPIACGGRRDRDKQGVRFGIREFACQGAHQEIVTLGGVRKVQ